MLASIYTLAFAACSSPKLIRSVLPSADSHSLSADGPLCIDDPFQPGERWRWHLSKQVNPKGTVILVHGLNNRPSSMIPIANLLSEQGYHVLRLALSGHLPDEDLHRTGDALHWRRDVAAALREMRERYPTLKRYGVGYSLGAALLVNVLDSSEMQLDGLVLLAPAVAFSGRATVIRMLSSLRIFGLSQPSRNFLCYRAHSATPYSSYGALFSISDSTKRLSNPGKFGAIPTTILVSRRDELISFAGIKQWLDRHTLTHWRLTPFEPEAQFERSFRHLIIDEPTLGEARWRELAEILQATFS